MEFTFEIISETNINVRYNYGGEWFTFNLFHRDHQWILHPFDSSLIRNKDMSRLVVADLIQHKPFQVMLAKEGILLSELNTSIPLHQEDEAPGFEELPRFDRSSDIIIDEPSGNEPYIVSNASIDIDRFIQENDLEDLVKIEQQFIQSRQDIYNEILKRMFMADLGPSDPEFQKVQQIVKAYADAKAKLQTIL